jgi:uncharacterized protein (DUF488 family)
MPQARCGSHQQSPFMSSDTQEVVFTIGHSTHPREHFIALLRLHAITALGDLRSVPYSRVNPQFNREEFKDALRVTRISYVFLGKELGARRQEPTCYERGKVQYDRIAQTSLFGNGLQRVQEGMKNYRLALMCSEKEPLECHRAILVARHLIPLGINVQHIHADGTLESHAEALNRLDQMLNLLEDDRFCSREELLYRHQEERIAYDSGSAVDEVRAPSPGAAG